MGDILENKNVKTRKQHNCWGCCRTFEPGSDMRYIKEVEEGDFKTSYWCKTCDEYSKRNHGTDEGIAFGELRSEDPDGWESVRKEIEYNGGI